MYKKISIKTNILTLIIIITMQILSGCSSKSNEFNDPDSMMYYNRSVLSGAEVVIVESKYEDEGYACTWDENGYLTLGKMDETEEIIQISSFSRFWPKVYQQYNLIPCPFVFDNSEGPCDYIRGNMVYFISELTREYLYVKWTKEQAIEYTEFVKQSGFNVNQSYENKYVTNDYYYSATNADGIYIAVQYVYNEKQKGIGYILIEIPNETEGKQN